MAKNLDQKIDALIKKAQSFRKEQKLDISSDEDLTLAIMNLVSIEEHFFFTAEKTGKDKYFDLLGEVREIRKDLLKKIVKDYEGEVWCISKHLLASSMRLIEVGTKYQTMGKKKEAKDLFDKAYQLYSLFWGINKNIIETRDIKKIGETALSSRYPKKGGVLGKLGELVKKVVDCCIE